jgi:hypothetical protein
MKPIICILILAALLLPSFGSAQPQGCRYLIVAADEYADAVRPLADWKTQKGILARVVKLSETGSTPAQVRSWIRNAWSTWPLKPEYVLLACSPSQLIGYGYCDDTYYGDMTGNYVMELPVGRLPAEDLHECSTMVAKTLAYERLPETADTLWYLKGTTIVSERNPSDPDPYYQIDSRLARQYWVSNGFGLAESLFNLAGDSSPQVLAALHDGRAFMTYRGVAGGHWDFPFFNFYPGNWHNGARLPVVVGATCYTITLAPGEEMLGNASLRYGSPESLSGMVAYFGTTLGANEVSQYRSACYRGFFRAIYDEGQYRLGAATLRGRWRVDSLYHEPDRYTEWALLGDPELNLWTSVPKTPGVTHAPTIEPGSQVFPVTVTADASPVSGALVCCLMDSTVYSWDTTDASGQALLSIGPTHPGPMAVTVSGRNLRPYEGGAVVLVTGAAYVSYLKHTIVDSPPAGNGDSLAGPGETITLPAWVFNYGDSTAQSVTAVLSTADTQVTMLDSVMNLGDIPGRDSACTSPQGFRLSIAPSSPDRHIISFDLKCRNQNGDTWSSGFTVMVCAPILTLSAETIVDTAGNRNGRLDPCETAQLVVTLSNSGLGPADSTRCVLSSTDARLVVTDSLADIGTIPANSVATNAADPFAVTAADMVPETQIRCTLRVYCHARAYAFPFVITVGATSALDPIPDGPRLPPQYWALDDVDAHYPEHPTYDWVEINGVGTRLALSDNQTVTVDLPAGFGPFKYYGRRYTQVSVCSNGWLAPGTTTSSSWTNVRLPRTSGPPMLAVNWDDLYPATGSAAWYLCDTAEHRFIVQWDSFRYRSGPGRLDRFQVVIYDTTLSARDGNNEFIYQYATANWIRSSTIGIQDPTPSIGTTVICDTARNRAAAPIYAHRAIKFTTDPPIVGITEAKSEITSPKSQMLSAFPNPSTGMTTIRLSTLDSRLSPLVLRIYDSQGRLVRTLTVNRTPYTVWDGRDNSGHALPSGAYFVILRAGTRHATARLVLQR